MTKFFVVILLLTIIATKGICQTEDRRWSVGVAYAPAINRFLFTDELVKNFGRTIQLQSRITHNFGVLANYRLKERWHISSGVYWMDYGYYYDFVDVGIGIPLYPFGRYKSKVSYLELPIRVDFDVLKYPLGNIFISTGGILSFFRHYRNQLQTESGSEDYSQFRLFRNNLNRKLYALQFGVGMCRSIGNKLSFTLYPNAKYFISKYAKESLSDVDGAYLQSFALDILIEYQL